MTDLLPRRRLWVMYKQSIAGQITTPHERVLAQHSFYAGAQVTVQVIEAMLQHGDYQSLHETIQRHGRRIKAIQRLTARVRPH